MQNAPIHNFHMGIRSAIIVLRDLGKDWTEIADYVGSCSPADAQRVYGRIVERAGTTNVQILLQPHILATSLEPPTWKKKPKVSLPGASRGFPYLDLPPELRLMILEYSDLVSPLDIQWRQSARETRPGEPKDPFDCHCLARYGLDTLLLRLEVTESCLCTAVENSSCLSPPWPWKDEDIRNYPCKTALHPLFLVSKQVRDDAIRVYYSRNRFVLCPFGYPRANVLNSSCDGFLDWFRSPYYDQTPQRVSLSAYLDLVPRTALHFITYLEWVLPCMSSKYMSKESVGFAEYLATLDMMNAGMNTAILTLAVHFGAGGPFLHTYPEEDKKKVDFPFPRIVCPISRLQGLKDFFVYLPFARRHNYYGRHRTACEQDLEQMVMGEGYDSDKRGKPPIRYKQWCEYGPWRQYYETNSQPQ